MKSWGVFLIEKRSPSCLLLLIFSAVFQVNISAQSNAALYIEGISYNDTAYVDTTGLTMLRGDKPWPVFPPIREIEFHVASDSLLPDTLEYKLYGLADDEWSITTLPVIRYTNLTHPSYEILFRGKGFTGKSQRFSFEITPAKLNNIREEWWFQPLLTFCLLLIPFSIIYFLSLDRSRRNLRVEVVRNQIASDLHDDVGANLGAINNLTEMLKKRHEQQDAEARTNIIDKIKAYTRDTVTNLQDTVWAINPLNDSIEELLIKMKEFTHLMLSSKDISIQYDSNYNSQYPIKLDMQQRHGMLMMFKEVINNIVKHSEATAVEVEIHNHSKTSLSIRVKDNGKGFDTSVLHRGNGLKNFQNRAKDNFVDLDIQSEPGKGAEIKMVIHSLD